MNLHVVLVAPEIAPNTGAIIRLCANTGARLHLVEPLGFALEDRLLKRGGLDYHEHASVRTHRSLTELLEELPGRAFGFSSSARRIYTDVEFAEDDVLVFGCERQGLTASEQGQFPASNLLTIPMRPENRSLNLANAAAIVLYEAWRQHGFDGAGRVERGMTAETLTSAPFDQ